MKRTVLLFDMDGVLVEPRRYRAALQSTMDFFGSRMGWESLYPGENTIAWFESRGIISEWDMVPLYLAGAFEAILQANPQIELPSDLLAACDRIKEEKVPKSVINIEKMLDGFYDLLKPGLSPCDQVLDMLKTDSNILFFPSLSRTSLLKGIFQHSRSVQRNTVTRVFQEIFLGQTTFERTFHLPSICGNTAAEHVLDHPLISDSWNRILKEQWQNDRIDMAIYTARPSNPGLDGVEDKIQFSPEAEMVLDQLGWRDIPCIGLGQLEYASAQMGCTADNLIKPSPAHALGAIGTAVSKDILPSIQAGWDLSRQNGSTFFDSFPELDIHIFEDSPIGITGVVQAVQLLKEQGVTVQLTKWGISTDPNKVKQLHDLGANIVPSVNIALEMIKLHTLHKGPKID